MERPREQREMEPVLCHGGDHVQGFRKRQVLHEPRAVVHLQTPAWPHEIADETFEESPEKRDAIVGDARLHRQPGYLQCGLRTMLDLCFLQSGMVRPRQRLKLSLCQ